MMRGRVYVVWDDGKRDEIGAIDIRPGGKAEGLQYRARLFRARFGLSLVGAGIRVMIRAMIYGERVEE